MTSFRVGLLLGAYGSLALLAGAKPPKLIRPSRSFVPPPAPQPSTPEVEPAPALATGANDFLALSLPLLGLIPPEDAVDAELRLRQSADAFQKGAAMLAEGDAAAARALFDQSLQVLWSAPSSLRNRDQLASRQRELIEAIHNLEIAAIPPGEQAQPPSFDPPPLEEIVKMSLPLEPMLKPRVKEQLQSTVSQLPLELADPVLGFINYFSSPRGKGVIQAGLRRSGRYAPMIRRILDEEGLPQELIFMAQAESGFLPRAVSYKKAAGMWQFVQFRGQEYGLKQTTYTDDRLDPELATRAAARHLRDLYSEFGDWYLAIAAYNCGPGNVDRGVQRTGYADFWEMYSRNVLPRETANYLPIILAMTIMAKNPKDYGLDEIQPEPALEYDTIELSALTHLNLIADLARQPLALIRDLNPAVLKTLAPAGYQIHLPKGTGKMVLKALEAVPGAKRASWRVHRIAESETIASIARQYRIPEKSITDANGKASVEAQAGDFLLVPVAYPGVPVKTVVSRNVRTTRRPPAKPSTVAKR